MKFSICKAVFVQERDVMSKSKNTTTFKLVDLTDLVSEGIAKVYADLATRPRQETTSAEWQKQTDSAATMKQDDQAERPNGQSSKAEKPNGPPVKSPQGSLERE